jgi:hypothetical protein
MFDSTFGGAKIDYSGCRIDYLVSLNWIDFASIVDSNLKLEVGVFCSRILSKHWSLWHECIYALIALTHFYPESIFGIILFKIKFLSPQNQITEVLLIGLLFFGGFLKSVVFM